MSNRLILQELDLPIYVKREPAPPASAEVKAPVAATELAVVISETQSQYSDAHQAQLAKIMQYLGFAESDYTLYFADTAVATHPQILAFGDTNLRAPNLTQTHSLSAMLATPAIKREVHHVITPLKKA